MEFFLRHKRAFLTSAVVLCIVCIFFTAAYRVKPTFVENTLGYVITPMQKYVGRAGKWVEDKFVFFTHMYEINDENTRLKDELETLKTERSRFLIIEQHNIELSELLKIAQKYPDYPMVGAEVIAKDPGNWYDNFIIDKGTRDGLSKNMVVMSSGGLVGRIMESGTTYSKVKSLIDDTSSVSAKSVRTGDRGFVKGDMSLMSEGLCRMEYIDATAEISEGDEIVTSNLGEIYPPGLTIGHVTEIKLDANGLTKYAIIQPSSDFKHLETVLVIYEYFGSQVNEADENNNLH